jgi:hypothetical protein
MANQTVDELEPTVNLQDTDYIEVTVDLGGGNYGSYKMLVSDFKNNIAYKELTKINFTEAGSKTYNVAQYEKVVGYTFVQAGGSDSIKITNNLTGVVYVDATVDEARDFNYYTRSSQASERRLKIDLNAAGTVYIHSIKNLIP